MTITAQYDKDGFIRMFIGDEELMVPDDMANRHRRMLEEENIEIAPYVEPVLTDEEIRASMPTLTRRQLLLQLLNEGFEEPQITAEIDKMTGKAGKIARIEWKNATQFERLHPLVLQIGTVLGFTDAKMDEMWGKAKEL